ncbi:hypothetical protein ACIPRI_09480 [Variovorax sp. LARHSF232]
MKRFAWSVLMAAVIGGLVACGGGGDDNGYAQTVGGEGYVRPVTFGESLAPVVPQTLTLEVAVNGTVATPDAEGQLSLKSGDLVSITPNQSVGWITASQPDGAINALDVDPNPSKWSGRIVNTTSALAVFTVSATATADASQIKKTAFRVAAPNGS